MHKESISLGNSMGLTPSEFNEKRRDLRAVLQCRATERKRKHPNSPSARRLQKKRMRLGSGMMNRHAIIQSMETDGVPSFVTAYAELRRVYKSDEPPSSLCTPVCKRCESLTSLPFFPLSLRTLDCDGINHG